MLKNPLLSFHESRMQASYARSNQYYYIKTVKVITVVLLIIAVALQVINSMFGSDELGEKPAFRYGMLVNIVAWAALVLFLVLCFAMHKALLAQHFVCPLLTIYVTLMGIFAVD